MEIQSTRRAATGREKAVTHVPQEASPETAKSIQEEHLSALDEAEKLSSNADSKDAKDGSVSVLVSQIGTGLSLPLAWQVVNIPRQATAEEIASELIAVGADPETAISFAESIINKISDPNIRNIIISAVAGLAAFTFIYKLKVAIWLKIAIGIVASLGVFYFLATFFPNPTEQKQDEPQAHVGWVKRS